MKWEDSDDVIVIRCPNNRRQILHLLADMREERHPYLFITENMIERELKTILVPVSRLEEDIYKAEICTYLARKEACRCILLCANDYGSMAERNTQKIVSRFNSISQKIGRNLPYEVLKAQKSSADIVRETTDRCTEWNADMIILSASRDYGLDDIIFGPIELYAIRNSPVPVMLINPRDDLFSLCD